MSYDPYAESSDVPPEAGPAELPPGAPVDARKRVQAPAIALIVAGILNLLWVGWIFFNVAMITSTPANQMHQQMLGIYRDFPQMQDALSKMSPDDLKNQILFGEWGWLAFGLVSAVLTLAGGIRMLSLKSYALGVCGAVCAAIPCISCGGCCLFGEIIGVWALVILLDSSVRAAFQ